MPQKTRKAKERAAQRRASGAYILPQAAPSVGSSAVMAPTAPAIEMDTVGDALTTTRAGLGYTYDYSYVKSDLRRIAILAGSLFLLMFVLAIFYYK